MILQPGISLIHQHKSQISYFPSLTHHLVINLDLFRLRLIPPLTCGSASLDSTDSIQPYFRPSSGISHTSNLEVRESLEPICAVCSQISTIAHQCPACQLPVHTICEFPVVGSEYYGSPVWRMSCYLGERETTLDQGQKTAKRGQENRSRR